MGRGRRASARLSANISEGVKEGFEEVALIGVADELINSAQITPDENNAEQGIEVGAFKFEAILCWEAVLQSIPEASFLK